ncbi:unnamed protein product [Nyctereutes procyonoides]|uniref:(raccoon dog) hypothetical protein n=1 Tax=Nyctereutes procyonoides TaxID=34880 RepID=A0A811Y7H9_NYCPR|nr:unnamed protein product [Nyctereutes procyonoides]
MLISQAAARLTGSTVRQRRLSFYTRTDAAPMAGKAPAKGPRALGGPGGPVRGAEVDLPGPQVAPVRGAEVDLPGPSRPARGPGGPGGPVRGAEVALPEPQTAQVTQEAPVRGAEVDLPGDPGLPPEDPPVVAQAGASTPLTAACSALAMDPGVYFPLLAHLDSDEPHRKCISCCVLGGSQPRAATPCVPLKHHDKCKDMTTSLCFTSSAPAPAPGIARPPRQGHRAVGRQLGCPPPPSSRPASASPGSSQRGRLAILQPGSRCLGPRPPGGVAPGTRAPWEQGTCPSACVQRRRRSQAPGPGLGARVCRALPGVPPAPGTGQARVGVPEVPVLHLEGVTDSVGGRLLGDRPRGPRYSPPPLSGSFRHPAFPAAFPAACTPGGLAQAARRPRPTSEPGHFPRVQGPCRHGQAKQLPDRALKTALPMGAREAASPAVPGCSGARITDCTAPSTPQEHLSSAGPETLHPLPPAACQPDEDEGAPISSREAPSPPEAREDLRSHPRTPGHPGSRVWGGRPGCPRAPAPEPQLGAPPLHAEVQGPQPGPSRSPSTKANKGLA